jgi:hypothetical protein
VWVSARFACLYKLLEKCCSFYQVYVLKALGAEIVRTPTTAAYNSAGKNT